MHLGVLNTIVIAILVAEQIVVPVITARRIGWRRVTNNLGLTMVLMLVLPLLNVPVLVFASQHELWARPDWMAGPAMFVVDFLILDFVKYAYHRMAHRIPLLWRFHLVHHLDEKLDMSTNDRAHLADKFLRNVLRVGFMMVFAVPLASLAVAEVISTAAGLFHHKASLRVPRWITNTIGRVVTMPGFHAVHHSSDLPYTDSNYSITLCFWDSLLGTCIVREPLPGMRPGLDDRRDPNLATLVVAPLLPSFDVHAVGYSARNVVGTAMRS
jgi:sterol desaturase/sphingolipid hydroxylase (fatty acid hydroxylase superfamily)